MIDLTQQVHRLEVEVEEMRLKMNAAIGEHARRWRTFENASFGGVPMAQHLVDLLVWESVLNSNRDVRGIVEIGTWQGGFSGWLWAQAQIRQIGFVTFDAVKPTRETRGFVRLDVFADPEKVVDAIEEIGEPIVLFCDGGNKPRELRTFPPFLRDPRSIVAVHDWGTETLQTDVPDRLTEVYGSFCDEIGSITRFFRVPPTEVG